MIIVDTNVVSELMRPIPTPSVLAWANSIERARLFSTSVTVYEVEFGIQQLKRPPRKELLERTWTAVKARFLADRFLMLDAIAAEYAARTKAQAVAAGFNVDICDLLIAGIALRERAPVATRNARHFLKLSVTVIDPWTLAAP